MAPSCQAGCPCHHREAGSCWDVATPIAATAADAVGSWSERSLASWPDVGSDALRCHFALPLHRSGKWAAPLFHRAVKIAVAAQEHVWSGAKHVSTVLYTIVSCSRVLGEQMVTTASEESRKTLSNPPVVVSVTLIHHYLSLLRVSRRSFTRIGVEINIEWFWDRRILEQTCTDRERNFSYE